MPESPTVDEEEVRTEEDDTEEEGNERALAFDPNNSVPNLDVEDGESDERIMYPLENWFAIPTSGQTMYRGSTSFASDQDRRLVLPNRSGGQLFQATMPPGENLGLSDSLVTQPPYENESIWSDQTMYRGSTLFASDQDRRLVLPSRSGAQPFQATMPPGENLGLGDSLVTQPPYENESSWSDQTMYRGSTSFASDQERRLVTQPPYPYQSPWSDQRMNQQQQFTIPNRGFAAVASVQNIVHPFGMHQPTMMTTQPRWFGVDHYYAHPTFIPGPAFFEPNTYQTMMMQRPIQNIVPRPNQFDQSFGMLQQDHIYPHVSPGQAPMRPMMQQDQIVPNLLPGQSSMRLMMQQDRGVPNLFRGQGPMRPMMQQDQFVPSIFPGQALMYNQEQDQTVLNVVPVQAPMWPMMYNQNQTGPIVIPNQALARPMMHNQQQRFNQGQHFGFPREMVHQQPSPIAAAAPRPELNHQQRQQRQPQTQQTAAASNPTDNGSLKRTTA